MPCNIFIMRQAIIVGIIALLQGNIWTFASITVFQAIAHPVQYIDPPHFNWSRVMDSECGGLSMSNKRPKPEEIVSKLRQVEVLMGQGMSRLDAIRQIGVVEQTYYRWRKQYGGMGVDQLKELKRLQKENDRLRRAVSDLTLDKLILKEAARGNF